MAKLCYERIIKCLRKIVAFVGGFSLGQVYYYYLLKQIPFPYDLGKYLSLVLSVILGIGNVLSTQLRCICVLIFPMYCGKPGRGVLKAVILTYIVTGPITNMGLNAREVVRVFACSTRLLANLSRERYDLMLIPIRKATIGVGMEVEQLKDGFRKMRSIIKPLQQEIEDSAEISQSRLENNLIDAMFSRSYRSDEIERKFLQITKQNLTHVDKALYKKKFQYRCENELSRAEAVCMQEFMKAYGLCMKLVQGQKGSDVCSPLNQRRLCDLIVDLQNSTTSDYICSPPIELNLGVGYASIHRLKREFVDNMKNVHLQYRIVHVNKLQDTQDATETAQQVEHAFEEKTIVMQHVLTVMNVCMALLFLRIFEKIVTYHDMFLTSIDYDNLYITGYFKLIDARRSVEGKYTLLPLKKMERNKYIDVYSVSYKEAQRSKLMLQVPKVMLEVVTATTFVMLDRMFFEALEVVRQHAEMDAVQKGTRDFYMEVEGTGMLAAILRGFLHELTARVRPSPRLTSAACLPHPRQMPYIYFLKIYGGYLWIMLLLFANPYTLRLKRLICSYFYPLREKQRILHLYNDILKKRMKMHKTLRRKAVQAVRAHYLSGETLLSARMKFPSLLGWLRVLPAARMACLICGETEPRTNARRTSSSTWHSCLASRCPFVYCAECWREAGARCLACDPSLAEMSDIESLTDSEPLKY